MSEKAIRIGAKLYDARDAAKRLLGARYAEYMTIYRGGIEAISGGKMDTLSAAMALCKKTDSAVEHIYILAAAVEMIEPTSAPADTTGAKG